MSGGNLFISGAASSASFSAFNGKWGNVESVAGSNKPYAVFDIFLTTNGAGELKGSYCFVAQSAGRIDCDSEGSVKMLGRVPENNQKIAVVNFNPFFGASNDVAELTINDDNSIVWNVITQPTGGDYYGPNHAVFQRIATESNDRGVRSVVADRVYI